MYNQDIKGKFISEFSTSKSRRKAALDMFGALEPYEEKWGADVCTRSKEELLPVIEKITGIRTSSQMLRIPILRQYARWCKSNNVEGACDDLLLINQVSGLDKIKHSTVANPQHLNRYLNCICDVESEETVDCIYRGFYWLAYSGMKEKDALNVPSSCVDLSDMIIRFNGREYPLYRESLPAISNCIKLKRFNYKNPNYQLDKQYFKDRIVGTKLLRGIGERDSDREVLTVRSEMARKARKKKYISEKDKDDDSLNLKLSYQRVQLSGLFYRTYEAERAGMPVDFLAAADQFMEGKVYKSEKRSDNQRRSKVAKDYLDDYNRWKDAYSI